jgi:hypothetical protein
MKVILPPCLARKKRPIFTLVKTPFLSLSVDAAILVNSLFRPPTSESFKARVVLNQRAFVVFLSLDCADTLDTNISLIERYLQPDALIWLIKAPPAIRKRMTVIQPDFGK